MTREQLLELIGEGRLDLGYQSSLFLLSGFLPDPRVEAAIVVHAADEVRIDFDALLREPTFSTGEEIIIRTALSLFRGGEGPGLGDLTSVLDKRWIERCLDAARLRAALPLYLNA